MKFGVVYYKDTDNVGDDIQTYAAVKNLPSVDYYLDREALNTFAAEDGEAVAVVMNAWYLHRKYNWPPSPSIRPLCVSMHFSPNDPWGLDTSFLDGYGAKWLQENGPVGCRDLFSLKVCEVRNINAYFSGCLTLTLPQQKAAGRAKPYVCAVDLSPESLAQVHTQLQGSGIEVVAETHHADYENHPQTLEQRFMRVEKLLGLYQGAHCVVTTRLHCALPCLAMGVPVLLLYNNEVDDSTRFASFSEYVHFEKPDVFQNGLAAYSLLAPPPNKEAYKVLRQGLQERTAAFINEHQHKEGTLPPQTDEDMRAQMVWRTRLLEKIAGESWGRLNSYNVETRALYNEKMELVRQKDEQVHATNKAYEELSECVRAYEESTKGMNIALDGALDRAASAEADRDSYRQIYHEVFAMAQQVNASHTYRLAKILRGGLVQVRSLNPVRVVKYIGACFAYVFGAKKPLQRYSEGDALATMVRLLSQKVAQMQDPHGAANSEYKYVPLDHTVLKEILEKLEVVRESGKPIIWFLAPMFRSDRLADGYYRRIKAIDDIVGDSAFKVYLENSPEHSRMDIDFVTDNRWAIAFNQNNAHHVEIVKALKNEADINYSHSVMQITPSTIYTGEGARLFVDMHGISPEENVMFDNLLDAQKANDNEEFVANYAKAVVVVTDAMKRHYLEKYEGFRPGFVLMPIFETDITVTEDRLAKRDLVNGKPVVVYAGGLQKWQCIEEMQDAIAARNTEFAYRMFTNDPAGFETLWAGRTKPADMVVGTRSVEALKEEYNASHYGFVLREENEVNRVSCPTKLVEYLQHGIVPIMDTTQIGDFVDLGMRYVALEDFLAGKMPAETERWQMAVENLAVLEVMNERFVSGRNALRQVLGLENL